MFQWSYAYLSKRLRRQHQYHTLQFRNALSTFCEFLKPITTKTQYSNRVRLLFRILPKQVNSLRQPTTRIIYTFMFIRCSVPYSLDIFSSCFYCSEHKAMSQGWRIAQMMHRVLCSNFALNEQPSVDFALSRSCAKGNVRCAKWQTNSW